MDTLSGLSTAPYLLQALSVLGINLQKQIPHKLSKDGHKVLSIHSGRSEFSHLRQKAMALHRTAEERPPLSPGHDVTAGVTLECEVPKPNSAFSSHKNIVSGVAWFGSFRFCLTVDSLIY